MLIGPICPLCNQIGILKKTCFCFFEVLVGLYAPLLIRAFATKHERCLRKMDQKGIRTLFFVRASSESVILKAFINSKAAIVIGLTAWAGLRAWTAIAAIDKVEDIIDRVARGDMRGIVFQIRSKLESSPLFTLKPVVKVVCKLQTCLW